MTPLDPMFSKEPISMWDVLAEGLASQGVTPQAMMSFSGDNVPPQGQAIPPIPPLRMNTERGTKNTPVPSAPMTPRPVPKSQDRVPQNLPPQTPVQLPQGPMPENTSPLDPQTEPQPAAQPEPQGPPGSPLDIRPPAQIGPPAAPPRDSAQLALAGLKAMQPEKAYIPPPPSIPRPDTGGLARIDPMTIMKNMQTGGPVPLLLLSQLLGRG